MPTINSTPSHDEGDTHDEDDRAAEAVTEANQDLNDQGDVAADDAGGTAAAHRVDEALEKARGAPD